MQRKMAMYFLLDIGFHILLWFLEHSYMGLFVHVYANKGILIADKITRRKIFRVG